MKEVSWTVKLLLEPSRPCDLRHYATGLHDDLNGAEEEWAQVHVTKDFSGKQVVGVYATVPAYNALRAIQMVSRPVGDAVDGGLSEIIEASARR